MSDLDQSNLFFVYGTLKRNSYNSRIFDVLDGEYVGPSETKDKYILGNVGFPYMFPYANIFEEEWDRLARPVVGDLWKVGNETLLKALDRIEGVPSHYQRELIQTTTEEKVWAYLQREQPEAIFSCSSCDLTDDNKWIWRDHYGN